MLSKGALAKRADKWQRDMMQLQQKFVEYNQDIQKKQSELTQPVLPEDDEHHSSPGHARRLRRGGRQERPCLTCAAIST